MKLAKLAVKVVGALRGHQLPEGAQAAVDELHQHIMDNHQADTEVEDEKEDEKEEVKDSSPSEKKAKKKKKGTPAAAEVTS